MPRLAGTIATRAIFSPLWGYAYVTVALPGTVHQLPSTGRWRRAKAEVRGRAHASHQGLPDRCAAVDEDSLPSNERRIVG
jgi:hypothetical protein